MRFFVAVLAVASVCVSSTSATSRDNVVTKTKNLITTFLTAVQAGTVSNVLEERNWDNVTALGVGQYPEWHVRFEDDFADY